MEYEKLITKHEKCRFLMVGFSGPELKHVKTFLYDKRLKNISEEKDGDSAWEKLELAVFHFILINVDDEKNKNLFESIVESNRFVKTPIFIFSRVPSVFQNSYAKRKLIGRYLKMPISLADFEDKLMDVLANEQIERSRIGGISESLDHYTRGCKAYDNGNISEAKEEMRLCLKADPHFIDGYIKMSEILIDQQENDTAMRVLKTASELAPENARIYYCIGLVEAKLGNREEAQAALNRAVKAEPNNVQLISDAGNICMEHNWTDEALQFFNNAKTRAPDFLYIYNRIGIALSRAGKFDEAEEEYNKAIEVDDNDAGVYFNIGMLWLRKNDKEKAADYFKKSLSIDANLSEAKEMLDKLSVKS